MQYILTEEEFTNLSNQSAEEIALSGKNYYDTVFKLCRWLANELPVVTTDDPDEVPEPYLCIVDVDIEHWCDQCPALIYCPYADKNFSQ